MDSEISAAISSGNSKTAGLNVQELNSIFHDKSADDLLKWGFETFGNTIVAGTGFGSSGIVLLHRLVELGLPVKAFCLDTNLLFHETHQLWNNIEKEFGIEIEVVSPILTLDGQKIHHKDKLWATDADQCCTIRKVLPLKKYLANKKAWITGLRRSQSTTRRSIEKIEWDAESKTYKLNPLADWSAEKVWQYIHSYKLPYNALHNEGYPSIGCIPCTHPANDPSNERSGRWANLEKTECGIHILNQLPRNKNSHPKPE